MKGGVLSWGSTGLESNTTFIFTPTTTTLKSSPHKSSHTHTHTHHLVSKNANHTRNTSPRQSLSRPTLVSKMQIILSRMISSSHFLFSSLLAKLGTRPFYQILFFSDIIPTNKVGRSEATVVALSRLSTCPTTRDLPEVPFNHTVRRLRTNFGSTVVQPFRKRYS